MLSRRCATSGQWGHRWTPGRREAPFVQRDSQRDMGRRRPSPPPSPPPLPLRPPQPSLPPGYMERVFEINFQHGDLVTTPLNLGPMPWLVLDRRAVDSRATRALGRCRAPHARLLGLLLFGQRCALSCCCATRAAIACSSPWLTSAERSKACRGRMTWGKICIAFALLLGTFPGNGSPSTDDATAADCERLRFASFYVGC